MSKTGRFVRAKSVDTAWRSGLGLIWRNGDEITDRYGLKTKELLNLVITIEKPDSDGIPAGYRWKKSALDVYAEQILSKENKGFAYTYGERLRNWNGKVDQIEEIIKQLKRNTETRRATAVTWIPDVDHAREDVPCMVVCDFKIRDNKLHLTTAFRSHDFAGAYPANVYALTRIMQHVSSETGTG